MRGQLGLSQTMGRALQAAARLADRALLLQSCRETCFALESKLYTICPLVFNSRANPAWGRGCSLLPTIDTHCSVRFGS